MNDLSKFINIIEKKDTFDFKMSQYYVLDIIKSQINNYKFGNQNNMYQSFKNSFLILQKQIDKYIIEQKELQEYDYFMGQLSVLLEFMKLEKNENVYNVLFQQFLSASQYSYKILSYIYNHPGTNQKGISCYLDMRKSQVSEILSRLELYKLFYYEKRGRDHEYYVTELGMKLMKDNDKTETKKEYLSKRIYNNSKQEFILTDDEYNDITTIELGKECFYAKK